MTYHLKNGVTLRRDADFSIVIAHDGVEIVRATPSEFASAIAAVSRRGDEGAVYREALGLLERASDEDPAV